MRARLQPEKLQHTHTHSAQPMRPEGLRACAPIIVCLRAAVYEAVLKSARARALAASRLRLAARVRVYLTWQRTTA